MLSLIVSIVGLVALTVCMVCTICYPLARKAALRAYRDLMLSEGAAVEPARDAYFARDRRQKGFVFTALGCYAVGVLSILPLGHAENVVQLVSILALTLCIWIVSGYAAFTGDREWEIRREVDELRHQERLARMRKEAEERWVTTGSPSASAGE